MNLVMTSAPLAMQMCGFGVGQSSQVIQWHMLGKFAPSLVVGDISHLPEQVKADFKTTGLTHLTAVSGTNLTLMLVFTLGLARQAGVRGWWLRGMAVLVAAAFIVVCRAEPSVLRAAAMGSSPSST